MVNRWIANRVLEKLMTKFDILRRKVRNVLNVAFAAIS